MGEGEVHVLPRSNWGSIRVPSATAISDTVAILSANRTLLNMRSSLPLRERIALSIINWSLVVHFGMPWKGGTMFILNLLQAVIVF